MAKIFSPRLKIHSQWSRFPLEVQALTLVSLFTSSGSTTWRRTASTARGRTTCRSCCGPPSPESSGRSAKTFTIWCVQSPAFCKPVWTERARRPCETHPRLSVCLVGDYYGPDAGVYDRAPQRCRDVLRKQHPTQVCVSWEGINFQSKTN